MLSKQIDHVCEDVGILADEDEMLLQDKQHEDIDEGIHREEREHFVQPFIER